MDKQPQNKRFSLCRIWNHASYILINEIVSVVSATRNPIINVIDCFINAVGVIYELRVVFQVASLVQVRSVNEVPVILPFPINPLFFELICECSALNKWIIELRSNHVWPCSRVNSQHLVRPVKCNLPFSGGLKHVIGCPSDEDMAKFPKSMRASEKQ